MSKSAVLLLLPLLAVACSDAVDGMVPVSVLHSTKNLRVKEDIRTLRGAVDQHYAMRGEWPEDWSAIQNTHLDPWGEEYVLEYPDDEGPVIYSMGPDREAGTDDDVG